MLMARHMTWAHCLIQLSNACRCFTIRLSPWGIAFEQLGATIVALRSLLGKLIKAQAKLAEGTWQLTKTRARMQGLEVALALLGGDPRQADKIEMWELSPAIDELAQMIDTTERALPRCRPGSSQHGLLTARLRALQMARLGLSDELDRRG